MSRNHYDGLNPYLVSQVYYHARQLHEHPALHKLTISDLEQELMLGFLLYQHKYNPNLSGWKTFVNLTLMRVKGHLIEQAVAKKRGYTTTHISYDELSEEPIDVMVTCELHIALTQAANKLPAELAELLRHLYNGTLKDIARQKKTSYFKLHYQMIKLRSFLKKIGLKPS